MDKSDNSKRTLHAFIPSKLEVIIIPIAVFLFLVLSNSFSLLQTIDGKSYPLLTEYMEVQIRSALRSLDQAVGPQIPLILFWMIIGIIVYILCWFAYNFYAAYKNDVSNVEKGLIAPEGFDKSKAWHENLAHFLTRIIAAVLLIFWLYLLFTQILPSMSGVFLEHITNFHIQSIPHILYTVIVLSASTFVVFILARCIVLRDRVFFR